MNKFIEFVKVIIAYAATITAAILPGVLLYKIYQYFDASGDPKLAGTVLGLLIIPTLLVSLGLSNSTAGFFIDTWGKRYE